MSIITPYNYMIHIGGKKIGYHALLELLEMQDEIVHGKPLSAGGAPQVATLCSILSKQFDGVKAYYNGNQIF